MRRRGWARKVERYCCTAVTYFPLLFVYSLTSWAVWVEAGIAFVPSRNVWTGKNKLGCLTSIITNIRIRQVLVCARRLLLPHAQLELHDRRLHRSRVAAQPQEWLQPPAVARRRGDTVHILHGQGVDGRIEVLQQVPVKEARPLPPLLDVQALRPEDGPSLPVACDMRRSSQLQGLRSVSDILERLLLDVLCDICYMGMERNLE